MMRTKEEIAAYNRAWRLAHPGYNKRWKAEHPMNEYQRKRNREAYAARIAELKKNPEKYREYCDAHNKKGRYYYHQLKEDPVRWARYREHRSEYQRRRREESNEQIRSEEGNG